MKTMITLSVLLTTFATAVWADDHQVELSTPEVALNRFHKEKVWDHYSISTRINPFYLRGDLDGDGKSDYIVMLNDSATGKEAVAFVLSTKSKIRIFPSDDRPAEGWRILERGTRLNGHKILRTDALLESFGGPGIVSVWNGKKFVSYMWGD